MIFDLDGVIADTVHLHFLSWKRLLQEMGMEFTKEENEGLRGLSRKESLAVILKGRLVSSEEEARLLTKKNRYYLELVSELSSKDVLPGVLDFLQELKTAKIKRAVASSSRNARILLKQIGVDGFFDVVVDGNDVDKAKPAPDLFLEAATALGVPANACLVLEDASAGIKAARAAGMSVVGLGPRERVGEADWVFASATDLSCSALGL